MNNSILDSIKKLLGISDSYDYFDQDIIMHINSVFVILNQLGVGPDKIYSITNVSDTWSDFMSDETIIECIKSYIYLRVKLLFDPPTSSSVIESIDRQINELEWRMSVLVDELKQQNN